MTRRKKRRGPDRPASGAARQTPRTAGQATGDASTAGGAAGPGVRGGRWHRVGVGVVAVLVVVGAGWWFRDWLPGPLGATTLPPPREAPPVSRFTAADFVGADRCASCHKAEFAAWSASTHGHAGGQAAPGRVIAAFNGQPIRFRDAVVTPRVRSGVYEFVIAADADTTQILRVDGVIGGGHMVGGGTQGFVTKTIDGTYRFLPFDWSRGAQAWFCNTGSRANIGWAPITAATRLGDCGDWPLVRVLGDVSRYANCQSCHASQLRVEDTPTGHTTTFTSLAINCESCHGPGRRHVDLAERGALTGTDVGLASLRTLGKDASINTCLQCHAVKDQLQAGFVSGDSLLQFYSLGLTALGERPLTVDGRTRTFAYQEAHRYSDCYVNGGMTCTSCHDPHSQGYRTVSGEPLADRFDDRQCTSCHPSKAIASANHTRHVAGTEASRCTTCHMPYLSQPETTNPQTGAAPIPYRRSDHAIAIPRPRTDSILGVRDACVACHKDRSVERLESEARQLWGPGKPLAPQVTAQLRVEEDLRTASRAGGQPTSAHQAELLWRPPPPARPHVAATSAGVARYLDLVAHPDSRPPAADLDSLLALATDPDIDVRALALATLHLAAGDDRRVRRVLIRALRVAGDRDFGLRQRWSLALGFKGDQWAEAGAPDDAVRAYRLALELRPDDPALYNSLGNALRARGDALGAIAAYQNAVRVRPRWGLGWVNLGITRLALGDSAEAVTALQTATDVDPTEPLGWFNRGNVELVRGALAEAEGYFDRAVQLDGGLTDAHFQLARIHLLRREPSRAYAELRRALAVDSTNAAARDLAAQLRRALTGR